MAKRNTRWRQSRQMSGERPPTDHGVPAATPDLSPSEHANDALSPQMSGPHPDDTLDNETAHQNGTRREIVTSRRGMRYVRYFLPDEAKSSSGTETEVSALDIESGRASLSRRVRQFLIGAPIPTDKAMHERIGKAKALAVLSSDALSSVAYGTEASMAILATVGVGVFGFNLGIGLVIVLLLAIVAFSYRQTIMHYPTGGGSYIVAKSHLNVNVGLVAAAALLLDYILTVSVSVSAGVDAITSAFAALYPFRVIIGLLFIAAIVLINLRGVRESGSIFAVPTYLFVGSFLLTLSIGFVRAIFEGGLLAALPPQHTNITIPGHPEQLTLFLVLTAFASGCSAMTGTEAIADGVPIFKGRTPPEQSQNAAKTLVIMATLLGIMYTGTTYLTWRFGISPQQNSQPTVISQIAGLVWLHQGPLGTIFYYLFQFATTLILTLAA
ncbi:MAG TPA: APC family permease, partial [Ktedonobacterales bacterium]|nr:APC family permease [Ktedonobacterales bacterium]